MEGKPQRKPRSRSRGRKKVVVAEVSKPEIKSILKKTKNRKRTPSRSRSRSITRKIRSIEKKIAGPKPQDTFATVSTLGVVLGNDGREWSRSFRIPVHPVLTKNAAGVGAPSPLADRAKNYGLWRLDYLEVIAMPLVGASMVSGSLMFIALTQDGSKANPTGPDDVLAQYHCEVSIGIMKRWKIPKRQLIGPRGGWWDVNTNEEANSSYGPSIDIWTYGQTSSLGVVGTGEKMTLPAFSGPLWNIQLKVKYSFSSWEEKPALANLHAQEIERDSVKIKSEEGELRLEITNALPNSRRFNAVVRAREEQNGVGQTIWQMADMAVQGLSTLAGPWAWLIKGGWWLVKAVFGAGVNDSGKHTYKIYASVEDAQRDHPCVATSTFSDVQLQGGMIRVMQLNSPNLKGGELSIVQVPGPIPKKFDTFELPIDGANGQHYEVYDQQMLSYNDGSVAKWWSDSTHRNEQAVRLTISGRTSVVYSLRNDTKPTSGLVIRTDKPVRGQFVMQSPHMCKNDQYVTEGLEEICLWDEEIYTDHWMGCLNWIQVLRPGFGATTNQLGEPSIMGTIVTMRMHIRKFNPLVNPPWPWMHVIGIECFSNNLASDTQLRSRLISKGKFEKAIPSNVWCIKTCAVGGSKNGKPVIKNGVLLMTTNWCYHYGGISWYDNGAGNSDYYPVYYPYPSFNAGTGSGVTKDVQYDYYHPNVAEWKKLPDTEQQWHSGEPTTWSVVGRNGNYPKDPNNKYEINPRPSGEETESFEIIPEDDYFGCMSDQSDDCSDCPSLSHDELERLATMLASKLGVGHKK